MPIRSVAESRGIYQPQEIELMEEVFAEACAEANIDRRSLEGQNLAMRVIEVFDRGDTTKEQLCATLGLGRPGVGSERPRAQ